MHSLQFFFRRIRQNLKQTFLLSVPLSLIACAANPPQQQNTALEAVTTEHKMEVVAKTDTEQNQPKQNLSLSPELMYYILSAEVAGQRGHVGIAVDLYQRAANMVHSPALARRNAQVATLSRDQKKINDALERWIEVDPNDADIYITQVSFLILQKNFQAAVDAVNKALELAPDKKKMYLIRVSENLAEVAEPNEALNMLKQLKSYQEGEPAALFAYARMAFFYKRYEETLNQLAPLLLEAQPEDEDYLLLKVDTLQRMGRSEEALKIISQTAKLDNASQNIRFSYGKLLGDNGKSEEAREIFETILAENPDNLDVLFALGLLALEEKEGQLAKSYFTELLKVSAQLYDISYFMGLAEELSDNTDAALVWFASVPMQSQHFDAAQSNYVKLLIQQGSITKAREHLAQIREELPERALQYYLFESGLLREQGQNLAAFDLLSEALRQYPQSEDLRYSRAMIAESLDRLDVLESDLRWILERNPNNSQALNALGYTLTDRTNRHQEALDMITRALELKPNDPFYLDSLGWVYYRLGDLEKAEKYLREAMNMHADVEFIAHLGEILWEQGKQREAKQIWQKGLEQDANNQLLQETMRRYGL